LLADKYGTGASLTGKIVSGSPSGSVVISMVVTGTNDAESLAGRVLTFTLPGLANASVRILRAEPAGSNIKLFVPAGPTLSGVSLSASAITAAAVAALIGSHATSSLQVGDALLAGQSAEAIALVDQLLEVNEPALRIVAALSSQIRGWLWVSLLDAQGEQDVAVIAKAAGIGNPKRIYVMRKQIRGRPPGRFLRLLGQLLEVEAALKRGIDPGDAFRDGFLLAGP
jgi:hypothetical protein